MVLPIHFFSSILGMRFCLFLIGCLVCVSLSAQRGVIHLTREDGLIDNRVRDVVHDDRGFLWIATANGLDRFDGQRFLHFQASESDPHSLPSNDIRAIATDKRERIWIATENKGLAWIHARTFRLHRLTDKQGISGRTVTALTCDVSGAIWCATRQGGLFRYQEDRKRFQKIALPDRSASHKQRVITQLFQDKFHPEFLWVSSDQGLFRVDRRTLQVDHFSPRIANVLNPETLNSTDKAFYSIEQDGKGNLYLGLDRAAFLYFDQQQGVFKKIDAPEFLPREQLPRIVDLKWRDTRYLYVCLENNEFLLFDARKKVFVRYAAAERTILDASCIVRNGSQIAVGSKTNGCYVHDERLIYGDRVPDLSGLQNELLPTLPDLSVYNAFPALQQLENLRTVLPHKNWLFIGHQDGASVFDLRSKKWVYKVFDPQLQDQVQSILIDSRGRLWLGTLHEGVVIYDLKSRKRITQFTVRNGLQDAAVHQIFEDPLGRIWVLNPESISVFTETLQSILTLEKKHGMGQVRSMFQSGNKLYFLEDEGYITSRIATPFPPQWAPQPYIQRLRILNNEAAALNLTRMAYNENDVRIEFGVLDFANGTNNVVSYRLKGLQEAWQSGNGKDEVDYYNLSAGSYVFELRIQKDGKETVARYPFTVESPFWLRWWFLTMMALLVFFLVRAYFRLRIRRVEEAQQEKAKFYGQLIEMEAKALRAQMNPHFLFNSLNSIRLFILKNDTDSASNYIAKFSKLLRMILNHSRQDMITVYDEMQSLKLYLEFERLRFDKGFDFDLQIDGQEVLDCQIPPMIIQPFVENAIWHGLMPREDDHGHIHVAFRKEPGKLVVEVRDNGIGRERSKHNNAKRSLKEGSVGLQITKDRLKALSMRTGRENDFEIIDCYDEKLQPTGTLVILTFETETR